MFKEIFTIYTPHCTYKWPISKLTKFNENTINAKKNNSQPYINLNMVNAPKNLLFQHHNDVSKKKVAFFLSTFHLWNSLPINFTDKSCANLAILKERPKIIEIESV